MTAALRLIAVSLAALLAAPTLSARQARTAATLTQDQVFGWTRVWTATLTFTPEQWAGIEPTRGDGRRFFSEEWLQGAPGERNGLAAARGIQYPYTQADLELDGLRFPSVAVRYKGNGTFNAQSNRAFKNSLKIDLNKFVKGQKLAGVSTLNFHNAITDPSFMNEPMAYRLYRDAGIAAPRTAYVRVYITVKGQMERRYSGLYWLTENVDANFVEAHLKVRGGSMFKPVSVSLFNDLGPRWASYVQAFDPKDDPPAAEQQRIMELCRLVTRGSDAEFNAAIAGYVDIEAFAKYLAVTAWLNNWDSILERGQNFYAFLHPASHKLLFIPWDQDHAFGNFGPQPASSLLTGNIYRPSPNDGRFITRMMGVPTFRQAYLSALRDYTRTVLRPERFAPLVAELAKAVRPDILKEPPKPAGPRNAMGSGPVVVFDELAAGRGAGAIVPFVAARTKNVEGQLARP